MNEVFNYLAIGGGALVIVLALAGLFIPKIFNVPDSGQFTKESLKTFNLVDCILYVLAGAALIVEGLTFMGHFPDWVQYICYGVILICFILILIIPKRILKLDPDFNRTQEEKGN